MKRQSMRTLCVQILFLFLFMDLHLIRGAFQEEELKCCIQIAQFQIRQGSDVEWNPSGTQIAVVSWPEVYIIDTASWDTLLMIPNAQANRIAWSPDGRQLATVRGGHYENLIIWDSVTGHVLRQTTRPTYISIATIYRLSWSPDGERIASDGSARRLLIWDLLRSGKVIALEGATSNGVADTDWRADSSQIVSGGADGTVRVWDANTGQNILTVAGLSPVDWHPTDHKIAGSSLKGGAVVWNSDSGQELLHLSYESVVSIRWNYDGSMIATGRLDGDVKLWNSESGELIATIQAHSDLINAIAWHPNQNMLASISLDGDVRIWRINP
jgi:WD40 repeat protein